jgi:hypothetical protein
MSSQASLPVRDAELARILSDHFTEAPVGVAEAIRALREAGCDRHRWLERVLTERAELRPLAERVLGETEDGVGWRRR